MKAPFSSMVEKGGCCACNAADVAVADAAVREKEEQPEAGRGVVAAEGGCKGIRGMLANAWILTLRGHSLFHPVAFLSRFPPFFLLLHTVDTSLSLCYSGSPFRITFPLTAILLPPSPSFYH